VTTGGARPARGPSCASDLDLNRLMAGEPDGELAGDGRPAAALRAHVGGCARCLARLERFQAVPIPPFADLEATITAAASAAATKAPDAAATAAHADRPAAAPQPPAARARRRAGWAAAATAVAMAATIVFLLRPAITETEGEVPAAVRAKGDLALGVLLRTPSGAVEPLAPGAGVRAGDTIRFRLGHAQAGYALVLGIDSRRNVSIYVPAAGDPRAPFVDVPGTTVLPGAVALDDAPGVEHVIALLCAQPPPVDDVRRAAAARLADPGAGAGDVRDLWAGCHEATFAIRKDVSP
jgi:hypothetical protein